MFSLSISISLEVFCAAGIHVIQANLSWEKLAYKHQVQHMIHTHSQLHIANPEQSSITQVIQRQTLLGRYINKLVLQVAVTHNSRHVTLNCSDLLFQ